MKNKQSPHSINSTVCSNMVVTRSLAPVILDIRTSVSGGRVMGVRGKVSK
jgi:hypothetical protein